MYTLPSTPSRPHSHPIHTILAANRAGMEADAMDWGCSPERAGCICRGRDPAPPPTAAGCREIPSTQRTHYQEKWGQKEELYATHSWLYMYARRKCTLLQVTNPLLMQTSQQRSSSCRESWLCYSNVHTTTSWQWCDCSWHSTMTNSFANNRFYVNKYYYEDISYWRKAKQKCFWLASRNW